MKGHFYLLIVALAAGSAAQSQDEAATNCPSDLPNTTTMKLFHGICYQFVSEEKYWQQARDYCLQHRGRLVKINDPETNEFIVNSLNALWWRNQGVWIGLHDITSETNWQWTGYELYMNEAVHWTNWGRGHPGAFLSSRRDCVRMVRGDGWRWHETFCSTLKWHYRFICEYKANFSRSDGLGPNPAVSRELPASDYSMLEGFRDHRHSRDSGEVRAVAANQKDEEKTDERKRNGSGIIALAIGCFLAGTLAIVIAFVLYRRRQRLRRYVEDDQDAVSKGKGPVDVEESKSALPRAVGNIYVTADVKGRVTSKLASGPNPGDVVESDSYKEEGYEDYEESEELGRESQVEEATAEEGAVDKPGIVNEKINSSDIYFEIPENDDYPDSSHIYETLDEAKVKQ